MKNFNIKHNKSYRFSCKKIANSGKIKTQRCFDKEITDERQIISVKRIH